MIIDDDQKIRLLLKQFLENNGFMVSDAENTDVAKKITCISDTEFDPWFRKMIPWKWRNFEEGKEWDLPTPHLYLNGKKKYPLF